MRSGLLHTIRPNLFLYRSLMKIGMATLIQKTMMITVSILESLSLSGLLMWLVCQGFQLPNYPSWNKYWLPICSWWVVCRRLARSLNFPRTLVRCGQLNISPYLVIFSSYSPPHFSSLFTKNTKHLMATATIIISLLFWLDLFGCCGSV